MSLSYEVKFEYHGIAGNVTKLTYYAMDNEKVVMSVEICMNCAYNFMKFDKQTIQMTQFILHRRITKYKLLCFMCYIVQHINGIRKKYSYDYITIQKCRKLMKILWEFNMNTKNNSFLRYRNRKLVIKLNDDVLISFLHESVSDQCVLLLLAKMKYNPT